MLYLISIERVGMTCIAGLVKDGSVYLAGERGASEGSYIVAIDRPKIWKNGPYIFGYAGTFEGQHIQHNFVPPAPDGNVDKFMHGKFLKALKEFYSEWDIVTGKESELSLLIGVKGKLYEHEAEGLTLISYSREFAAIGSGADYAMGSLHATQNQKDPKRRLSLAIGAACEYSTSCIGPVDFLEA
jgi:ATP-dependent protease HslVU (ClpYQ) peptidase subunit